MKISPNCKPQCDRWERRPQPSILLSSGDPEDEQLAAIHESVADAYQQLCGRLQTMLTEAHLQDLKNRTAEQLQQPRDLEWERARR